MSLQVRITDDMKSAMKARDSRKLDAIRLLMAAMKQKEVDERVVLTDADIIAIIDKMLKQRRDSIMQYEAANREDLAEQERFEMLVLQGYMPEALSEMEINALIEQALQAHGSQKEAMGKIMATLRPLLSGRADLTQVSSVVKSRLV